MPVKLFLHLRCLQPSLPIACFSTTMKTTPQPINPSRVGPAFSRVFPHKLKYRSSGSLNFAASCSTTNNENAVRKFSTRSSRGRPGMGSGQEVRAVKNLVEEEADLGDWVSGLSSKSYKSSQLYSDSEKDIERERDGFRKSRGRDKGMGDGGRGQKRTRENSFEEFDGSSRRDGASSSRGTFSRGRGRGGRNEGSRENGRDFNERFSGGGRGRGRFGGEMEGRRERSGTRESGSRFEMDNSGGSRGLKRGEKSISGRGRGGTNRIGRRGLVMSDKDGVDTEEDEDEDKKENGFRSFKELIDSDEDEASDEDSGEEEEEEDGDFFNKETVLAWRQKEDVTESSSPSSPGVGDSYLSETR